MFQMSFYYPLPRRFLSSLAILGGLCALCSCGMQMRSTPNPAVATALVHVSADYLRHVANADEQRLNNVILWTDFLEENELSKNEYRAKLRSLRSEFPDPRRHPLSGLSVVDVHSSGNDGRVVLQNLKEAKSPRIEIELYWGSNSWLVLDDNLFGEGELIERWTQFSTRK